MDLVVLAPGPVRNARRDQGIKIRRLCALHAARFVPGPRRLQYIVDVGDVLRADRVEPMLQRRFALRCEDGCTILPCGATAKDAVELYAAFGGKLQHLDEDRAGGAGG